MRALKLQAVGDLQLVELPQPVPGRGEVLLRVEACGLCRTDAKMWQQGQRDLQLPRVLGHEIVGVDPNNGRRYAVWPGKPCWHCALCRQHREHLCPHLEIVGFSRDGGFAEYVAVPRKSLERVPESLAAPAASMAEPLACCVNALRSICTSSGLPVAVLVVGAGPMGCLLALTLTRYGIRRITVLECDAGVRERSAPFLRHLRLRPAVPETTDCFQAAITAAPAPSALAVAIEHLVPGGRLALFSGIQGGDAATTAAVCNGIHYRELTVSGAYGCPESLFHQVTEWLSDAEKPLLALVEAEIPLTGVADAMRRVLAGGCGRFVVRPEL